VVELVRMPGYGSQVAVQRGDYLTAERLATQAETAARRLGLPPDSFAMAELVASAADVALEHNRTAEAEARIEHLMRIVDNGRRPLLEVGCHLLFARLAMMRRDDVVAEVHLDRARQVIPEATPPVVAHIDRVQLRHELQRSDLSAAESILGRLPPSVESDLLEARVRLSAGDDGGARDVLARFFTRARPVLERLDVTGGRATTREVRARSHVVRLDAAICTCSDRLWREARLEKLFDRVAAAKRSRNADEAGDGRAHREGHQRKSHRCRRFVRPVPRSVSMARVRIVR
jgi:phytoene dehydrogenase-like protein